jgi:hypothetical protein
MTLSVFNDDVSAIQVIQYRMRREDVHEWSVCGAFHDVVIPQNIYSKIIGLINDELKNI